VPAIPEGERGRGARRAAVERTAGPAPEPAFKRSSFGAGFFGALGAMGAAIAALVALLVLLAVLLWPIGLLTGDDEKSTASSQPAAQRSNDANIAVRSRGQVILAEQAGKPQMFVTATNLEPSGQQTAYQVWLFNSKTDRKLLGAQVTDAQGNFQAGAALPSGYRNYKFVDVTKVSVTGQSARTGKSVLRGLIKLNKPVTRGTGKQRTTVFGQAELVPLPGSG
jgi:hypothetical protein